MVQSLNIPAFRSSFRVLLFQRSLLRPHFQVSDINEINFKALKAAGCKKIVFDKDNCITAPYEQAVFPSIKKGWSECLKTFGAENIAIFSNSAGSSDDAPDFNDAKSLQSKLDVKVITHGTKKPSGGNTVIDQLNAQPNEIAFVGDRVLTDVVFGNENGFLTIHTQPLSLKNDNVFAIQIRKVENWLIKKSYSSSRASNPRRRQGGTLQPPPFIASLIGTIKHQFSQIKSDREQERKKDDGNDDRRVKGNAKEPPYHPLQKAAVVKFLTYSKM